MSEHVILLNSGKTDAYCHLVKFVPGDRVDVITERKYTAVSARCESALRA